MHQNPKAAIVPPPSRLLVMELEARKWSNKKLAKKSGLSLEVVEKLTANQQIITEDIATALEKGFGITAIFWLNVQNSYNGWLAEQQLQKSPASV